MKHRLSHILFCCLLLVGLPAWSQTNMLGHQNVPDNLDFNWKQVQTASFDVHFYSEDPVMGTVAGKIAEEALWDVCKTFDYKNKSRFALFLYTSPNDWMHCNAYPDDNFKDNGITPLQTNASHILFPGSYRELRERIRASVVRLLMQDYYFGGPIQFSITNTVLMYLPEWYEEGLSAYLGEGWDYEDEFWLAGLDNANLLNFAVEGNGPIYRTARKSIWYFIAQAYGPEKLGEIFYMTRLTRSVEDGLIHVLGITLKTLTDQWREFVVGRIQDNSNFREDLGPLSARIAVDGQQEILSFALHPTQPRVALYLEHKGRQTVAIYDVAKRSLRETPITGGMSTEQWGTLRHEYPMAWSPDGNQLVTVVNDKAAEYLAWYDATKGSVKFVKFKPALEAIYQIAWSPDGTQLVCSGLRLGQIDLFTFQPQTGQFANLTDDFHDDLFPIWNQEGNKVYFASTRTTETIDGEARVRYDANQAGYDIWGIDLGDRSVARVTRSPQYDEFPVGMASSFELITRSDQTGIYNLQKVNAFLGDSTHQTNAPVGMYRAALSDSFLAFATTEVGRLEIMVAPRSAALHDQVVTRCILRQLYDKAHAVLRQKQDAALHLDSLRQAVKVLTQREDSLAAVKAREDSIKTAEKPVKYYVFDDDDDDDDPQPRRRNKRTNADYLVKKEPVRPDFDETEVGSPRRTSTAWVADRVTARFGFDPVFKLSLLGEARLRDQSGHHQVVVGFKPYIDFRSSDTYLRYANLKGRVDWQVGLTRAGRVVHKGGLGARYTSTRLDGAAVLPLSRYLSVGAGAHVSFLERRNVELFLPKNIDGTALMVGGRLNLTYDHTTHQGNFITRGSFASVDLGNAYSLSVGDDHFFTGKFDLRHYLPLRRVVLATRLSGAWSEGAMQQRFFLGGTDEWLLGRWANPSDFPIEDPNLPALHYAEFITPIRGFQFNGRNGTKYFAANAELRIPVSRIWLKTLNSNPAYNIELIPFFDIGSTWTQGNPLSQKNPIDTETINSYPLTITVQTLKSPFLMGFGAGTRMQMFGYSMRFDLAWGVDDYTILNPRLHLSLGKNF